MPGLLQNEAAAGIRTETWNGAPEIMRELGLREQKLQHTDSVHRSLNLRSMRAQQFRQLAQDAKCLALFLLAQPAQLVIQVDGIERFHKQSVPAAAGAVNHAVHLALLARHHRHHKAIVAERDEILLQCAIVVMRAQKTLE